MDKLTKTVNMIEAIDSKVMEKAQEKLNNLTKPLGSLGRLEELAKLCAGITGKENLSLKNKVIFTFAGDHGVVEEGVSAFPKEVTAQMVYNFLRAGAAINVLAKHSGARVVVADLGVAEDLRADPRLIIKKINYGTMNMKKGPAMTREEAIKSIEAGITILEDELKNGIDIAGVGEMGIGNTTAASAITASFTGKNAEDITDKGTGVDEAGFKNKINTIKQALKINNPDSKDAIDVLSKVGGFEIGGLAGIILAAASKKVPVVLDGFISGAAALIAFGLEPKVKHYLIASHCSVERGHRVILEYLGLKPLFDLSLRLGEGTGAALGISLVESGVKIMSEMATFKDAGVSEKS